MTRNLDLEQFGLRAILFDLSLAAFDESLKPKDCDQYNILDSNIKRFHEDNGYVLSQSWIKFFKGLQLLSLIPQW